MRLPGAAPSVRWPLLVPVLVVACGVALLGLHAATETWGVLSPDSTRYLGTAANWIAGRGPVLANEGRHVAGFERLTIWPLGYPAMIAALAALTHLSVFAASKVLGALLFSASVATVFCTFGRHKWPLALLMLSAQVLTIFMYTWSEAPFVLLTLLLAWVLGSRTIGEPARHAALFAICVAMFMVRYVGLYALEVVAVYALADLRHRRFGPMAAKLATIALAAGIAAAYLWLNREASGYATGMPRPAAVDSSAVLARQLIGALASGMTFTVNIDSPRWVYIVCLAAFALLLAAIASEVLGGREPRLSRARRDGGLTRAFALTGALYLANIVALRWTSEFDPFDFRLLTPGVLPLLLAGANAAWAIGPRSRRALAAYLLLMTGLAVAGETHVLVRDGIAPRYAATVSTLRAHSAPVPRGAILVMGDDMLRYLRPDLHIPVLRIRPEVPRDETVCELLRSLDPRRPIYLDLAAMGPERAAQAARCGVPFHPLTP